MDIPLTRSLERRPIRHAAWCALLGLACSAAPSTSFETTSHSGTEAGGTSVADEPGTTAPEGTSSTTSGRPDEDRTSGSSDPPPDGGDEDGSTGDISTTTEARPPGEPDYRVLHCGAGGGNVVMLDLESGDDYEVVWEWRAEDAPGLPSNLVNGFRSMSDCKMVEGGTRLAIAGATQVALVDYPSGEVLVHGPVGAAHSVALLPGDRLIGVGSTAALIRLFEVGRSGEVLFEDTMEAAHGAYWDREREHLYVIGHQSMRLYSLADWDTNSPSLTLEKTIELPDRGAHDLSPIPGGSELIVTTRANVWRFDQDTEQFSAFDPIADERRIKSVDINPVTGRVAYAQGDESYWTTRIRLLSDDADIQLPGDERLYKVRWFDRANSDAL